MIKQILAFTLLMSLVACVETRDVSVSPSQASDVAVQRASFHMSEQLKDPESLKIRKLRHFKTADGDHIVCGEMDAKNSFGGYNGYAPFYVRLQGNTVKRAYFGEDSKYIAQSGCRDAENGTLRVAI